MDKSFNTEWRSEFCLKSKSVTVCRKLVSYFDSFIHSRISGVWNILILYMSSLLYKEIYQSSVTCIVSKIKGTIFQNI